MKLKVHQIYKLFLLLTVFCAELNYLKSVFCSALLMKPNNNNVHKKNKDLPVALITITRNSLIIKSDEAKINHLNNKSLWLNFTKSKISNKFPSKHSSFIISTTTTTAAEAEATTATSVNVPGGIKEYLNLNESLYLYAERVRGKSTRKSENKKILEQNIEEYEDESAKAINVKEKLASIHPMREKRQGRRQLEMRHSYDPVNKETISEKQAKSQQEKQMHRVAVLMPTSILNSIAVQQGFLDFVDFFQLNLHNVSFDFLHDNNSNDFISLLHNHKYTTVVKTLNTNLPLAFDPTETLRLKSPPLSSTFYSLSNVAGYCNLAESLSHDFNKSVLMWPCPPMKEPSNFLPSFEAISFAVQSIATKLNWSQVDIYVGDENWGLPLAIAANLHRPYKIVIDGELRGLHAEDKNGKAIIITADMNDASTLSLLQQLESLEHTKVLLIDYVATSFNAENRFYKNLARLSPTTYLMSNLLLLTVLSDKYRHFLNMAYADNGMEMVQNFRQLRRWKAIITSAKNSSAKPKTHRMRSGQLRSIINWPIHLDMLHNALPANTFISVLAASIDTSTTSVLADAGGLTVVSQCPELNRSATDIVDICQQVENLALNCANIVAKSIYIAKKPLQEEEQLKQKMEIARELKNILINFCQSQPLTTYNYADEYFNFTKGLYNNNNKHNNTRKHKKIKSLRNFIDFFHLYDFLIANAFHISTRFQQQKSTTKASANESKSNGRIVPKYDFLVLDVVRERIYELAENEQMSSSKNNTTSSSSSENRKQYNNGHNNANSTFKWRPLLILEQHEINLNTYITHSIQPGYDDWLLVSTTKLWHCGAICWTIISISFGIFLIIIAAGIAAGIAMRNYLLKNRLTKGPNKIVLSANDFVFPVDSRRVDEGIEAMLCCWLQQLQEFGGPEVDKPDLLKGSIGSLKNLGLVVPGLSANGANITANGKQNSRVHSLARHNPALLDMRARYNGDLVQLKEIPLNGSAELKAKAMDLLVMAHGLRHENINPLIGWLSDPNRTAMVFDYCSRGSLQDVLIMDEIKLDWSFRLSLLTDLVRGMRYLHASPLRVHGTLTSRNCVVDARWVLKITDYGVASFYEAQGLTHPQRTAKELLWTAPEVLRTMKPHLQQHYARIVGTQMGDVYSFGIIMQEVVVRGEPYCMLSLSAEEIIAKIKKPPPLIRPSVSKGAAPPEAINIMRQCWAEQPEMRPDFNSVYERFKMLNHGRKVNFVDTMFQMLEKYSNNLEELIRERTEQLDLERKKTEQLLNRMLPSSVAEKLKMGLGVDPEEFSDVTIYFSDIVGFTTIAAHCSPVQVVDLLNDLYTIFDATINAYNVYKVETIGDAYMVVSGVPVKIPDHADQIATMALDLLHQSGRFNVKHLPGVPLQLRIGLHTGPCCAGVVGLTMPRYCLFGDTVNTASRMESTGSSWRIHMSQETRDRLEARGGYNIESRGMIEIKGKGMMHTYWLLGKKGFDKVLPTPPPIGLDESFIRNSIILKAQTNKSRTSTNPSSSQSSSLAGESVEVKVEITPPTNADIGSINLPNSYSLDSNSTTTISPNTTLCPEFPTKTPSASPQSRKLSELTPENLLNPSNFNRLPSSTGGSSSRLYKKLEEIMDISSPYNHYKCLSPSESNLTQFYDGKYLYSGNSSIGAEGTGSAGASVHSSTTKFDSKPSSTRLLRRQFSLDRDEATKSDHHPSIAFQATHAMSLSGKPTMLEIPIFHDTVRSPKNTLGRTHKQNSTSIAQDLEKIEEIPLSPASSQHHSSLDSNMNRSPPSTVEGRSSQATTQMALKTTPPLFSAPTSPVTTRSLNEPAGSPTTDASTATTTASAHSNTNNNANATESNTNINKSELPLNAGALLSS